MTLETPFEIAKRNYRAQLNQRQEQVIGEVSQTKARINQLGGGVARSPARIAAELHRSFTSEIRVRADIILEQIKRALSVAQTGNYFHGVAIIDFTGLTVCRSGQYQAKYTALTAPIPPQK